MSTLYNNSINYNYLNLNTVKFKNNNSIFELTTTFKNIYSFFFYYRSITRKIQNESLFYFFSYSPLKYNSNSNFIYYKNNHLVFLNRSFSYWLNNHLVCNRYNPYVLKNSYLIENYIKYIYVFQWYYH